jgi:hypothetical protein
MLPLLNESRPHDFSLNYLNSIYANMQTAKPDGRLLKHALSVAALIAFD